MNQLRVGVVGASISGGWALQSHLPALATLDGVELTAVSTTRQESAQATAAKFGAAGAYTDAAALAADPNVDLVSVTVKVPDHDAVVRRVIAAGKPVYCEAPLGANSEQAVKLRDAAAAAGLRTIIGLQARVQPAVLHLRDLVTDGYLGRVLSVRLFSAGHWLGGEKIPANREWSLDRANGLSILTVRTAHSLDALGFGVAPIAELAAVVNVATPTPFITGTDRRALKTSPDQALVSGRLASGATFDGQFLLGVRPVATPLLTVFGTAGTLTINTDAPDGQIQMSRLTLLGQRGDDAPAALHYPGDDGVIDGQALGGAPFSVARMYASIRDSWQAPALDTPTFEDAVKVHQLLDAIQRASDERRTVSL
jgi:predicted dehydrogenase